MRTFTPLLLQAGRIELTKFLRIRIVLSAMVGGLVLVAGHTAAAQCASLLTDGDFEEQSRTTVGTPWRAEGKAGIDRKLHLSHHGDNNAWAGKNRGWNAIVHYPQHLVAGELYTLRAFVQTSGNVGDGYLGFRGKDGRPIKEFKFGPSPTYKELTVKYRPARTGSYPVFIGFWSSNQDSLIRIDRVTVHGRCGDSVAEPAE